MIPRPIKPKWRLPAWLGASVLAHAVLLVIAIGTGAFDGDGARMGRVAAGDGDSDERYGTDPLCLLDEALSAGAHVSGCMLLDGADARAACYARTGADFELATRTCPSPTRALEVTMIEAVPLVPNAEPPEEKPAEAPEDEDSVDVNAQVVDIAPPAVEIKNNDPDAFAAEYDSKVDKQTKRTGPAPPEDAKVLGGPKESPNGGKEMPKTKGQPVLEPGTGASGKLAAKRPGVASSSAGGQIGSVGNELGWELGPGGHMQKRGSPGGGDAAPQQGGESGGEGGDGKPLPGMKDLRPSDEMISGAAAGSYEDLRDIDEGADTLLNTKRWKYASFFNRVQRAVWLNWHPGEVYSLRDPTGQIYGTKDRLTVLKVSLKPDGSLAHVIIETPCGVDFLDDEAVSAFRRAQPFPHPPGGLVDKTSNLITFRFGFHFGIEEAPAWKIFRYEN